MADLLHDPVKKFLWDRVANSDFPPAGPDNSIGVKSGRWGYRSRPLKILWWEFHEGGRLCIARDSLRKISMLLKVSCFPDFPLPVVILVPSHAVFWDLLSLRNAIRPWLACADDLNPVAESDFVNGWVHCCTSFEKLQVYWIFSSMASMQFKS